MNPTTIPHSPTEKPARVPLTVLPAGVKAKPNTPELLRRELQTLVAFIQTYCDGKHPHQPRVEVDTLNTLPPAQKSIHLCADCAKLLQHALVKRTHCPQ